MTTIVHKDSSIVSTKLQDCLSKSFVDILSDRSSNSSRAGERYQWDSLVLDYSISYVMSLPGNHSEHTIETIFL
jgi:hypothetical protein